MIASILGCPKCNTLILEDTPICPGCHYVLKQDYIPVVQALIAADEKYDGSHEAPCRECNAMNRKGLVRCWQCGAFLQEEMERIYQAMQMRPSAVIASSELQVESPGTDAADLDDYGAFGEDDDFELADDVQMHQYLEELEEEDSSESEIPALGAETMEYEGAEEGIPLLHEAGTKQNEEEEEPDEDEELLKLAVREEKEQNRQSAKRKRSAAKGSFLIKGPCNSCKIRVQNYHQGMMGQCPKCALPFMVPVLAPPKKAQKKGEVAAEGSKTALPAEQILEAARWNEIVLKKFKPKPQLLAGKGDTVDVVRHTNGILFVWPEKKGLLGSNAKQLAKTREEISAHLAAGKPLEQLPAARHELIPLELLSAIRFAQPTTAEDFTTGVELFGAGLIALEVPALPQPETPAAPTEMPVPAAAKFGKKAKPAKVKAPKVKPPTEPPVRCLTLTLSQFRKLRGWLAEMLTQPDSLADRDIPLENATQSWTCQLSEQPFEALQTPEWYQADAAHPVTTVGWLCQCGEVAISETARAEQKFGGKKPAGLAKAKCPKCEQPFGQKALIHLTEIVAPTPVAPEKPAEEQKDPAATGTDGTTPDSEKQTPEKQTAEQATPDDSSQEKPAAAKKGFRGLFSRK